MNNKNVRYKENNKLKRKSQVTVCIAAIFNNNAILGVSDRMITSEDIEFQPPQAKIWPVSNSIAFMAAGDSSIQTQLYSKTSKVVDEKIKLDPSKWVTIEDVANIYKECYFDLKNELAKDEILSPYMLNQDTFIERQQTMNRDFIDRIAYKLETFTTEVIGTIIAGIDETGPHIYTIRNGIINCDDKIGFTSIGIGSNHALSHFMLSGYTKSSLFSKALLTIYQAKRKSEVSPGVGEKTDMFFAGPSLGSLLINPPSSEIPIIKELDKFYKEYIDKIEELNKSNEIKIENYINNLIELLKSKKPQESSPSASPSPSEESD